eukprot:SAG25_NODE_705_length_5845_cov_2.226940_4_plen_110_part_00
MQALHGQTDESEFQWEVSDADVKKMNDEIGSGWEALFTSFNMMFMSGLDIDLLEKAYAPTVAKVSYVYYVVVVPLIMLNLLIALMGGEHDRVKGDQEWEGLRCALQRCI